MYHYKVILQNIAITFMVLLSLSNVVGFYIWRWRPFGYTRTINFYGFVAPYGLREHFILAFTLGLLGLLVAVHLFRQIRSAWIIAMITQSVLLGLHLFYTGRFFSLSSLISLFILLVLGMTYKDFNRYSERLRVRQATILAVIPLALAIVNTVFSLSLLRNDYFGSKSFFSAFKKSIHFLLLMDTNLSDYTHRVHFFVVSLIIVSWICLIIAVLLVLKPLIYNPIVNSVEKKHVYELIQAHGQNPMAYMALMNDKRYFFGEMVNGVLAYTIANKVLVACGDMICAPEDAAIFLGEIRRFAYKNQWKILFLDITDKFRDVYESHGFDLIKVGEDACIDLEQFSLSGKARAKVRANVNQAKKRGLIVKEYHPLKERNFVLEHEMNEISKQWFKKKGAELGFMLGGLALENPMRRRYFYSENHLGKMQAFIIFVPYEQEQSFMVDVTRRHEEAPNGALEIIFAQAFEKMKNEGVSVGNLGLCPLAHLDRDEGGITAQLFQFIYENLNGVYGFKGLYQAKKKWTPTDWQPRYIACSPKTFGPSYAYAIIKAQNPKGINKLILEKLRARS